MRILLLTAALLLVGCSAQPQPTKTLRVDETATVNGTQINLLIDPLKIGENRLIATVQGPPTQSVEAHVIMTEMGHGDVVYLNQVAPGRYEASTESLSMEGPWMIRIKVTGTDDKSQTATFHLKLK